MLQVLLSFQPRFFCLFKLTFSLLNWLLAPVLNLFSQVFWHNVSVGLSLFIFYIDVEDFSADIIKLPNHRLICRCQVKTCVSLWILGVNYFWLHLVGILEILQYLLYTLLASQLACYHKGIFLFFVSLLAEKSQSIFLAETNVQEPA